MPDGRQSPQANVFSFGCFVLRLYNCLILDSDGKVSPSSLNHERIRITIFHPKLMSRIQSDDPSARPSFNEIYQRLFASEFKLISGLLEKSISRISAFNISKSIRKCDIEIIRDLGSGASGRVHLVINTKTNDELVIKEFNDRSVSSSSCVLWRISCSSSSLSGRSIAQTSSRSSVRVLGRPRNVAPGYSWNLHQAT